MFYSYTLQNPRIEYVPYEKTIIEKRAPTDDSIKLYEEIKEKAFASILDTISLQNNVLMFNAILYDDFSSFQKILKYRCNLNGEILEGKLVYDKGLSLTKQELVVSVYKKLSSKIVEQILKSLNKDIYD